VDRALRDFAHAWSGDGSVADTWPAFLEALPGIGRQLSVFADGLETQLDCCSRLADFIRQRL
jgi:hypothetical protein